MRRLLSILLLLVLGLPLFAPALGSAQQTDVPACCRRGGAHHCMMMAGAMSDAPVVRMACPAFPHPAAQVSVTMWTFTPEPVTTHELVVEADVAGQVEAGYRIAAGRSRHKRGPPQRMS